MPIHQVVFTLKTVTPLFMSGAVGKTPELRSPSFRGALRFWLRTLLGDPDISSLQKAEQTVFGSTSGASPVVVRVSDQALLDKKNCRPLPHSTDENKQFKNPAFIENQTFTLTLEARACQPELPEAAFAALLMLLSFGGVGKRARRGFGSLQLEDATSKGVSFKPAIKSLIDKKPTNGQELADHLKEVLNIAQGLVTHTSNNTVKSAEIPSYPTLSQEHTCVLVCQYPFPSYDDAMKQFWGVLRQPKFIHNIFGYAERQKRCASPLMLHIAQTPSGYHLVLTAMRSRSPNHTDSWSLVTDLLQECKNKWVGQFIFGKGTW